MSSADVYLENMTGWADYIETRHAEREGKPLKAIRADLAFSIGVPPSTFQDLKNGRVKTVKLHVFAPIRRAFIKELRREQKQLQLRLEHALAAGEDPNHPEIQEAQQLLAKVRELLAE